MILNRDDFFSKLHERVGTDTSEESITFLEDMTDTYNDLEKRANADENNWEQKYHELDESWKKRYRHRFFSGGVNNPDVDITEEEKRAEDVQIEDLFTKGDK